jgi:hypothetical protein
MPVPPAFFRFLSRIDQEFAADRLHQRLEHPRPSGVMQDFTLPLVYLLQSLLT